VEEAWLSVGAVRGTAGKYRLITPVRKTLRRKTCLYRVLRNILSSSALEEGGIRLKSHGTPPTASRGVRRGGNRWLEWGTQPSSQVGKVTLPSLWQCNEVDTPPKRTPAKAGNLRNGSMTIRPGRRLPKAGKATTGPARTGRARTKSKITTSGDWSSGDARVSLPLLRGRPGGAPTLPCGPDKVGRCLYGVYRDLPLRCLR
jgi:hypothetical protein